MELVRALSAIVQEELSHFHLVLDLLERRGIRFRKIPPSRYGAKLHALAAKEEPMRAGVRRFYELHGHRMTAAQVTEFKRVFADSTS